MPGRGQQGGPARHVAMAYRLDGHKIRYPALLLVAQRLVYRQIMYVVVWRALERALTGLGQAWGKLRRTGDVVAESP